MSRHRYTAKAQRLPLEGADEFTREYVACALWSSSDNADDSGGAPLDQNYTVAEVAADSLRAMKKDCREFQRTNRRDLAKAYASGAISPSRAGHDFWLNRNGHGAGFWDEYNGTDGELRAVFKRLSDAAKWSGTADLYVSDGKIHLSY